MKRNPFGMTMLWRICAFALVALCLAPHGFGPHAKSTEMPDVDSLAGRILVAAPGMADPRFAESVILMVRHDVLGAWGVIVNRPIGRKSAAEILSQLSGEPADSGAGRDVAIHFGGPVSPLQAVFLHSPDFEGDKTIKLIEGVRLTKSLDLLHALARGEGPAEVLLVLGYAGWGPGQLEGELRRKDWFSVKAGAGLLFDGDMASKWRRALELQSIDL